MRKKDSDEFDDFIDFVGLRERLVAGLLELERMKKSEVVVLEKVSSTAKHLEQLQSKRGWRVSSDVKVLAKSVGVLGRISYNHLTGEGLRFKDYEKKKE